jgi:hypothetical protein
MRSVYYLTFIYMSNKPKDENQSMCDRINPVNDCGRFVKALLEGGGHLEEAIRDIAQRVKQAIFGPEEIN